MLVISDGKTLNSKLVKAANDHWKRMIDKAKRKHNRLMASPPLSFTDHARNEFPR